MVFSTLRTFCKFLILTSCGITKYNTIVYIAVILLYWAEKWLHEAQSISILRWKGNVLREKEAMFIKQLKDDLLMPVNEVNHDRSIHTACKVVTDALG